MLKSAARLLLLRILPGRLIPIVTVAEAIMLIRSVRRRSRRKVVVNEPTVSRTAPPDSRTVDATTRPAVVDGPASVRTTRPAAQRPPTIVDRPRRRCASVRPRSAVATTPRRLPHI